MSARDKFIVFYCYYYDKTTSDYLPLGENSKCLISIDSMVLIQRIDLSRNKCFWNVQTSVERFFGTSPELESIWNERP